MSSVTGWCVGVAAVVLWASIIVTETVEFPSEVSAFVFIVGVIGVVADATEVGDVAFL